MEQAIGIIKQASSSKNARSFFSQFDFFAKSSLKPAQDTMINQARLLVWSCSVKFLTDFSLLVWYLGFGFWNLRGKVVFLNNLWRLK